MFCYALTGDIVDNGAMIRNWMPDKKDRHGYVPPEQRDPTQLPIFRYQEDRPGQWRQPGDPWLFLWNNHFADLTLRGLTIEGGRDAAIHMSGGRGNLIAGCTMKNFAGMALTVSGGQEHTVRSCHIYNVGAGGISITGGDRKTLQPASHLAENNRIHAYSQVKKSYSAAIALAGVGNVARHNHIHDSEHCAILFSGNDMVMEYNQIHDVVQTASDMGAIYTGRDLTSLGNIIRYNYFHDLGSSSGRYGSQAIFIDDASSAVHIHGNLFVHAGSNAAIKYHGGIRNLAENNIIIGAPPQAAVRHSPWGDGFHRKVKTHPTLMSRLREFNYQKPPYSTRYAWLPHVLEDDPRTGPNQTIDNVVVGATLIDNPGWWSEETGNWTTDTDPGFVDMANGNYALRADAQLFKHIPTFKPIPFAKIGTYADAYTAHISATAPEGTAPVSTPAARLGQPARQNVQAALDAMIKHAALNPNQQTAAEPDQPISRAELASMFCRALNLPTQSYQNQFTDVPAAAPYAIFAQAAVENGLLSATNKRFHPHQTVNRQQLAQALAATLQDHHQASQAFGGGMADPVLRDAPAIDAELAALTDLAGLDTATHSVIASILRLKLMAPRADGQWLPNQPATRKEAAEALVRMLNVLEHQP